MGHADHYSSKTYLNYLNSFVDVSLRRFPRFESFSFSGIKAKATVNTGMLRCDGHSLLLNDLACWEPRYGSIAVTQIVRIWRALVVI